MPQFRKFMLFWLMLIVLWIGLEPVGAATWESLPPDHWAYEEIRWLQSLGYLQNLDPSQRPWTRGEIAAALTEPGRPAQPPAAGRFALLEKEFKKEMDAESAWQVTAGARVFAGVEGAHGEEWQEAGYAVAGMGVGNARLGVFTALRADHDLVKNPNYKGKEWTDLAGLTEQAYFTIVGENRRWAFKFGRDHLYWGPGDDHLLLNYAARGIDQISFKVRWNWGRFTALVGQIDDFEPENGDRISRFLSGHRLEFIPWSWLRVGISETLLFSGDVRLGSMNPFVPFYGELVNENSEGNGMIGMDVVAFPQPGFEVYGELLLDDVQLENEDPGDLEPAEWGWLIGGRWSGLNGLLGTGISYSGITNRTYNAIEPKYRYLNYGLPLGSNLGNDGDRLHLDISCWPDPRLHLNAFWEYRRQGEGRVTAAFDTLYLTYTVEAGYSEPFPTGTVEKTNTVGLEISARPHPFIQIEGWIGHDWIRNYRHESGLDEDGFRGRMTLNVRLDYLL
jgi:hypothetical protein